MDLAAGVAAALAAAGEAFGPAPAAAPEPRWGALYAELDAGADEAFATDIELIYEGYLLHYRESRALALAADDLRDPAARRGLLLRARPARHRRARGRRRRRPARPPHGGLLVPAQRRRAVRRRRRPVGVHDGGPRRPARRRRRRRRSRALFDDVEAGFRAVAAGGRAGRGRARRGARGSTLPDPAPLLRELDAVAGR